LTITASDVCRRDFLPPRRWRGTYFHYPPSGFLDALVMEEESLDWQRLEGKRLGERLGAPTVLFMGLAKRSCP
jgi:hypothetical protein